MNLSIIVAVSTNGVIGNNGELPWRLSADLQEFKRITMGKPIIMGRLTHESIGRPLPGRENVVLTRNRGFEAEGCTVIHELSSLQSRYGDSELMVIGGANLYRDTISQAARLYMTEVHCVIEGDTYFPDFDRNQWLEVERNDFSSDEKNDFDYSFVVLTRKT